MNNLSVQERLKQKIVIARATEYEKVLNYYYCYNFCFMQKKVAQLSNLSPKK